MRKRQKLLARIDELRCDAHHTTAAVKEIAPRVLSRELTALTAAGLVVAQSRL